MVSPVARRSARPWLAWSNTPRHFSSSSKPASPPEVTLPVLSVLPSSVIAPLAPSSSRSHGPARPRRQRDGVKCPLVHLCSLASRYADQPRPVRTPSAQWNRHTSQRRWLRGPGRRRSPALPARDILPPEPRHVRRRGGSL